MPHKALYIVIAFMLLVAREDIDGLRISDRLEPRAMREQLV
jgi:hypothetical protein